MEYRIELAFGLGGMIGGFLPGAPVQMEVFRKPAEALAWLRDGD
jgi:hypothetical protein